MLSTCCKRFCFFGVCVRCLAGRGGGAVIFGWRCRVLREYPRVSLVPGWGKRAHPRRRKPLDSTVNAPIVFDRGRKFCFHLNFLFFSVEDVPARGSQSANIRSQASFGIISNSFELPHLAHWDSNIDKCGGNHILSDGWADFFHECLLRWSRATERSSFRSADISALIFCPFGNLLQLLDTPVWLLIVQTLLAAVY